MADRDKIRGLIFPYGCGLGLRSEAAVEGLGGAGGGDGQAGGFYQQSVRARGDGLAEKIIFGGDEHLLDAARKRLVTGIRQNN